MEIFRLVVSGALNIANKFCETAAARIPDCEVGAVAGKAWTIQFRQSLFALGCEVAAVASKSMERAKKFAKRIGCHVYKGGKDGGTGIFQKSTGGFYI